SSKSQEFHISVNNPQQVKITKNGNDEVAFFLDGLQINDIADVDPNDIQAVTVLKDATALALYPELKEKKGVILIETKNGKSKAKTIFNENNVVLYPNPADGILNL